MLQRWVGPIVVVLILGGVIAVLVLNLNLKGRNTIDLSASKPVPSQIHSESRPTQAPAAGVRQPAGFREYPIGDEFEKNEMLIKAVWLPPVQMEGMEDPASSNLIHLEADIHATEGNRNGFAKDEFVPYLVVDYTIVAVDEKASGKSVAPIKGKLMPMVARDGLHYGATIEMPGDGHYKLTYALKPPSAGGLGRHVDRATGVEPWWRPFEVSFDWDFHRED
jgi:periplasmic iron binding protein